MLRLTRNARGLVGHDGCSKARHMKALLPFAMLLVACSGSSTNDAPAGDDGAVDSSDDVATEVGAETTPSGDANDDGAETVVDDDAPFAAKRKACAFKAGAMPSDTFGPSIASLKMPLDTIVIAMQENRSFDQYFWHLRDVAGGYPEVDVPTGTVSLKGADGSTVKSFHQTNYCFGDTDHSWAAQHADWDMGKNDLFAAKNGTTADPSGGRVLGWFDETDLPFYYGLAKAFGISDRHFCSVLGPTHPNRFYLYQGTSNGYTNNYNEPNFDKTIFTALDAAKVSWVIYSTDTSTPLEGIYTSAFCTHFAGKCQPIANFATAAAAGKLPQVVWLDVAGSEHPPEDMQYGEVNVQKSFDVLTASPQWKSSAFIFTYDENGGLYDHVPPAEACKPDDIAPIGATGAFDHTGFRVPLIVASPYSKPHHLSHVVHDHTAILRFLELRFGMPALTARDANSETLVDFFDFSKVSFPTAPTLPKATVDAAHKCP